MFENPRRGIQARNFGKSVPRILDLKSFSEQIFSENCRWVPLVKSSFFKSCWAKKKGIFQLTNLRTMLRFFLTNPLLLCFKSNSQQNNLGCVHPNTFSKVFIFVVIDSSPHYRIRDLTIRQRRRPWKRSRKINFASFHFFSRFSQAAQLLKKKGI